MARASVRVSGTVQPCPTMSIETLTSRVDVSTSTRIWARGGTMFMLVIPSSDGVGPHPGVFRVGLSHVGSGVGVGLAYVVDQVERGVDRGPKLCNLRAGCGCLTEDVRYLPPGGA